VIPEEGVFGEIERREVVLHLGTDCEGHWVGRLGSVGLGSVGLGSSGTTVRLDSGGL